MISNRIKQIVADQRVIFGLWVLIALSGSVLQYVNQSFNNFSIYAGVFHHTVEQLPLYELYPDEYGDRNLYGIAFSLLIAPFALLPKAVGMVLWMLASCVTLYASIRLLPVDRRKHLVVLWFCANELVTSVVNLQFNILTAAFIVLAFALVERKRDFWATLFIVAGAMTKIYGGTAFLFFLFSKDKRGFLAGSLFWAGVLFLLPSALSSWGFMTNSYFDWFDTLAHKSGTNLFSLYQNISLIGFIRKLTGCADYSDLPLMMGGLLLLLLPLIRFKQYGSFAFRSSFLASILLYLVLFSSGSESSTYILAFVGVGIWFVTTPSQSSRLNLALLLFVFLFSSLSSTDLFPPFLREKLFRPYALKAIPCAVIWFKVIYEQLFSNYPVHYEQNH